MKPEKAVQEATRILHSTSETVSSVENSLRGVRRLRHNSEEDDFVEAAIAGLTALLMALKAFKIIKMIRHRRSGG